MGLVLLENLEKVGQVGFQCDDAITAKSKEQNYLYYLNNHTFKQTKYR